MPTRYRRRESDEPIKELRANCINLYRAFMRLAAGCDATYSDVMKAIFSFSYLEPEPETLADYLTN